MKSNFYNQNLLVEIIESYSEGINSRKKILIKEFDTTRWRIGRALEMDEIAASYPPKFWDKIKYLRPERTTKIPNECYMDIGTVTADTTFLKQKWKS